MDGFIVIDKPKGPTSHQIDYWVREITGEKKVGHVGTLDPNVTGVLVMALGRAVKLIDIVHEFPKEYVFVIRFHSIVPEDRLREAISAFTGDIYQIPPMRSAVARNLRVRRIHSMDLMEYGEKISLLRVRCESGTYIRTLCTDMGYFLGTGGQMSELRRTFTGPFTEDRMVTLQDLSDAVKISAGGDASLLNRILIPMDYIFRDTPKIVVKKSALKTISHGSDLFPGGIKAIIGTPERGDRACVVDESNNLVGTGKMLVSYRDIGVLKVLDFDRILIEPDAGEKGNETGKAPLVRKDRGRESVPVQKPEKRFHRRTGGSERRKDSGNRPGTGGTRRNARPEDRGTGVRKKKNRR